MKHGKLSLIAALVAGFAATFGGSAFADAPLASGLASTNSVAAVANYKIVVTNVVTAASKQRRPLERQDGSRSMRGDSALER